MSISQMEYERNRQRFSHWELLYAGMGVHVLVAFALSGIFTFLFHPRSAQAGVVAVALNGAGSSPKVARADEVKNVDRHALLDGRKESERAGGPAGVASDGAPARAPHGSLSDGAFQADKNSMSVARAQAAAAAGE